MPPALPAPPEAPLAALFGDRRTLAVRFAGHLAGSAVERGLVGPREIPRIWERHILNCAVVHPLVGRDASVVDVGSGAGLPGLVLAIARPDLRLTLVEPLQRRVVWLEEVVDDLRLDNVQVVRARAEALAGGVDADVATARAVAALPTLAGWCLPLLRPGGVLLALKGQSAEQEVLDARRDLEALGADSWSVLTLGEDVLEVPTTVVSVLKGRAATPGRAATDARTAAGRASAPKRRPRRGRS